MRAYSNNKTSVWVVHQPAGERHRAVLQITLRFGRNRSEAEHLAFQSLLSAIRRMQDVTRG